MVCGSTLGDGRLPASQLETSRLRIRYSSVCETPLLVRRDSFPSMRNTYSLGVHSTEKTWKLSAQLEPNDGWSGTNPPATLTGVPDP